MKYKITSYKLLISGILLLTAISIQAQIDPGVDFDLNGYINSRLDAGETTVVVPPGRYRVANFGNTHLKFNNRNNVTIIADGVEMICTETVQAIQIQDCINFKLQGMTVDYDPLPFTQGEIVAISADKLTLTVDLIDGYSSTLSGDKVEIYDSVTGELSARTYYGSTYVVDTQARRVIVTKGAPVANFTEKVGDIVVIGSRGTTSIPHTITPSSCTNLILENVTIYSGTSFAFFETNCKGSKYINCSVDRRPLETEIKSRGIKRMRSNNADAFHSKFAEIGPSYVGCVARYNGDDSFAINGDFHIISETNGNVLTVIAKGGGNNSTDFVVGEVVELVSYSGERIPDATITQIQAGRALNAQEINFLQTQTFNAQANDTHTASNVYNITIDRSIDLPLGSLINSATRVGNGFEVRNCIAGPNRSRGILVKASDGIITGNTCVGNWGQAIKVSPEYSWLEAGSSNNLVISNNIISGCHDAAIAVYANGGNGSTSPIGAHENIQIIGNQISGSSNPNIAVTSTSNLCMTDNTISSPNNDLLVPWIMNNFGRNTDPNRTIYLENVSTGGCNDFGVTGVIVIPETASIVVTETYQLTVNILPSGATNKSVTWSSSDPSVATVDSNGLVTAVAEGGPVTITATTSDGGFSDTSIITVIPGIVYIDEVKSVSGPTIVNQGATIVIEIVYTASTTRDIVVNFQENGVDFNSDGNRFTTFGTTRATVSAGQGTLSVDVATSTDTPISVGNTEYPNPYRHVAFMTTVGDGYAQRLDEGPPMTGISVTDPTGGTTYTLTVDNGAGDGNYQGGTAVAIEADAAPEGQEFDRWELTSGSAVIADVNASSTIVTTASEASVITALYKTLDTNIETTFASPFSNNMVLQRNDNVKIWGRDNANTPITVTTSWNNQTYNTTTGSDGKWSVVASTPEGSDNAYTLTATGTTTATVSNLLIGEVWMCSGQSNMEMAFGWPEVDPAVGEAILASATDDKIRGIRNNRLRSLDEQESFPDTENWKAITGNTAKWFSMVAYYYAKKLREELGVPIGLINNSYGGSKIEAWLDTETANQFNYITIPTELTAPEYVLPTVIYNAAVNPWIGFGMKGVLWYQGESNKTNPDQYAEMLPAMVNSWRQKWGIGDFPFYYVQIVPYQQSETSNLAFWNMMREAYYEIPNSGVVVTLDNPSCDQIHPQEKEYVGDRLAFWALAKDYGFTSVVPSGPLATSVIRTENTLKVNFDYAETGLVAGPSGFTNFQVAGSDQVYYDAQVQLNGDNTLTLTSNSVSTPKYARYGAGTCASLSASLFNGENLPASPFIIESVGDVFALPSNNFSIEVQSETCPNRKNGKIIIEAIETYNYVAIINGKDYDFIDNKLSVEGMQPGTYSVCISVEGETFEQCFNLTIYEGKTVSGKATVNSKKTSIEITQGTAPFKVFINEKEQFEISSKSFDLEVNHGDFVQVKTAVDCEGVYSKTIDLFKEINAYPNPTNDFIQVKIPNGSFSNVQFKLYDLLGKLVFGEQVDPRKDKWQIEVSGLAKGIYVLKITADDQVAHHKIVKK